MFLQGWVNGILVNESSVYGTLCIVLLTILNMGLYFSEIDTRDWPYRRHDLLLPFNHSFAIPLFIMLFYIEGCLYGERIMHGSLLHRSYAWKFCMGRCLRNK